MRKILITFLAIFLIFEEWLWDLLSAFGRWLVVWLNLSRIEQWLSQTSPNIALLAFGIPLLIVAPINIVAVIMLANGLILQGIALEITAKLLATVLVARVFALTKPQLLSFKFFESIYTTIMRWLEWAHQKIVETPVYEKLKHYKAQAKAKFAMWFN
ncbi:hypothetical protein [Crenothrix sp.]|uniref:hypothetical protein n=1 Tax=Crenothrix sp. TaxID=3100433 RepID=UPI00374DE386